MSNMELKSSLKSIEDWIGVILITLLLGFAFLSLLSILYYVIIFGFAFVVAAKLWSFIKTQILNK